VDRETPAVIEAKMADTRQSLTEKVSALEDSVVGTVQSATTAVADTVQTVKDAVGDTVGAVKENVSNALDISRHVRENPWIALGVAGLAGFLSGVMLRRPSQAIGSTSSPVVPTLVPRETASATPSPPRVGSAFLTRIEEELLKLSEFTIERISSELHRAVEDGVPRVVDKLSFITTKTETDDSKANAGWNGTHDPIRRAS
jgi:ElaB/YqjD/DUF883 family membrane-anchored ribosome-binding protein